VGPVCPVPVEKPPAVHEVRLRATSAAKAMRRMTVEPPWWVMDEPEA